jgi:lipopolysaccharide transport system permease protein
MASTPSLARVSEPTVVIRARKQLFDLDFGTLWAYRELLYFLIWRDLKVRYRQTVIGAAWVVLQPLLTMAIFTIIFGRFARIPSDGLPYPLFCYTALVPWTLFSSSLSRGGESVVGNANLVTKVYFPRLLLPLSGVLSPLVDFAIAAAMLVFMMAWYRITPTVSVLALPFFVVLALCTALAVSVWLSALNVRYRDVRHTIPFLLQVWMFASPISYPISIIPERWRLLYSLNPLVGVIEGFRWALLGKESPDFAAIAVSTAVVMVLLAVGLMYFRQMERTFADEV